jgi:multidrug efflux system membrane fusion protein
MPELHLPISFRTRPTTGIAAVATVIALGLGLLAGYRLMQAPAATLPAATPAAVPVQTAFAARRDVPIYFDGLGTVQAFNTVTVTTRVDGQLQRVNFVEGQDVKTGDILVQIDPRTYRATFEQAVSTKAKDEAQLANAKLDLARYETLAPQGFTSKQTLDTQKALVAQLDAQVKMDQAAAEFAATNLDYTTIKSPISGRTGIRLVDVGNNVLAAANTSLVVVTQLRPISIIFTLPADDLPAFTKAAAAGPLTVLALSRDLKTELDRGTVAVLDNQIVQATGTIRLKATFPNTNGTLWPGQFVNARLLTETKHNVLTIPSPAVQRGPNGLYAYVVKSDSTVEMRPLTLDQLEGGQAIITEGLMDGEQVVMAGQYRLQPGAHVRASNTNVASAAPLPTLPSGEMP